MPSKLRTAAAAAAVALLLCASVQAAAPANFFTNPSLEMGSGGWRMDKGKGTVARFAIDEKDAADGQRSMLVEIGTVGEYGTQFGQIVEPGAKGKTYTFGVLARSVGRPIPVMLEIERCAKPYDRALRSKTFTITPDKWTELHATFTVEKAFPEGWFAYISCREANVRYRCDMFRLCEGAYLPYEKMVKAEQAGAGVRLYDTGAASPGPLSPSAITARTGWTQVPEDNVLHTFKGDTVLLNNRLAVVLRKRGRGAEVYAAGPNGMARRAALLPAAGHAAPEQLAAVKVTENGPGAAAVDATFSAAGGEKRLTVNYALAMGQVFVKTEPRAGARALTVEAPCRFAVLPDFFADDIVIDAADLPVAEAELPADHFLLHLAGAGDAMVMAVWNPAGEFVRSTFAGEGQKRRLTRSTLPYGKDGKVWVAVLQQPGIWHSHDVAKADAGKIVPLAWRQPFPGQWRMDWRRDDGLTDSWEMIAQRQSGNFTKIGWFGGEDTLPANRKRWTTVLGSFAYPCWIDRDGRGHIQPLRKGLAFEGPAVIYPINRGRATPLDVFTVVDIVRTTLGVGPCEYILDVEGQRSQSKGRATCSNRDVLNGIYAKREQKKRRADIEKSLAEVMVFIRYIRGRIEQYVAFGHELLAYLAEQKKAHPELAGPIAELERLAREIDARYAAREAKIKTPAYAAGMVERFKATVLDDTSKDALEKCKQFTEAWVEIGGNQDELVGECRWAVKVIRQRAGLPVAKRPRMAEIGREIRRRTQKVLRSPAGHEGARH